MQAIGLLPKATLELLQTPALGMVPSWGAAYVGERPPHPTPTEVTTARPLSSRLLALALESSPAGLAK